MPRIEMFGSLTILGLMLSGCAAPARLTRVDPFPLRFPLVEVGTLEIEGAVAGQPRARDGIVYFATREGHLTAVVVSSRAVLWRSRTDGPAPFLPEPAVEKGFVREGNLLRAIDGQGRPLWEFQASGAVPAEPVLAGGRVYFGDLGRMFYCLAAATGKVKWRRRLYGAPLHPAVIRGGVIAVAASNSVVYLLSRRGGSILSWEALPSRVVHELVAAGPFALASSASPIVTALDLKTGKRAGQYQASGPLVTGAVWSPPYVVLFVEDEESGRQKIVFLRSR